MPINPNTGRRTDAIIKGDIFDLIMKQQENSEMNNLPEHIYDYPEHVLQTLIQFQKLWMLPPHAIPSKKIRGRFNQWINELDQINTVAGHHLKEILPLAFKKWEEMGKKRFIVSHPLSTLSLIVDVMSEMNRNNEEVNKQKEATKFSDSEKTKNTAKQLKSLFDEE